MSEACVSDIPRRRIIFQGYTQQQPDVLAEIAATRIAFVETWGVPADICITHQDVAARIPVEDGLWIRWWGKCPESRWYWGNTASVQ